MQNASLDNCKELYELSGWYYGFQKWYRHPKNGLTTLHPANDYIGKQFEVICPAYDAGYLMRKLPKFGQFAMKELSAPNRVAHWEGRLALTVADSGQWVATYLDKETGKWLKPVYADTPENALCQLAIELFKAGVLTKGKTE